MSNPNDLAPGAQPAPLRPRDTQPIPLLAHPPQAGAAEPPAGAAEPQADATIALPVRGAQAAPEPEPEPAPAPGPARRMIGPWVILGSVGLVIVLWAGATILRKHAAAGPAGTPAAPADQPPPPPPLRAYYDRASNGDVSAMRMLGTMYYNGLNVPQDMKEGVRWYRKAAAAGSVAAAKDLEQLGLTVKEP